MRRLIAGFLVAVGLLFVGLTIVKRSPTPTATPIDSTPVSAAERGRVQQFWQTYRRATAHRIAGRWREAADEYRRALTLDPEHLDALYYLGNMELDLGNFAAAETAWKRLIALDPTSARAHAQLGTIYFCVGEGPVLEPAKAQSEFERAARINREETGPLLSLGEIALVEGDLPGAHDLFDAVIGSNYSSVEAHFYEGYIAWKAGATAEATALLTTAVQYAQPQDAAGTVAGEGDTESGSAPMVRPPARCDAMRARANELVRLDPEGNARGVYGVFDDWLQEVRRSLP